MLPQEIRESLPIHNTPANQRITTNPYSSSQSTLLQPIRQSQMWGTSSQAQWLRLGGVQCKYTWRTFTWAHHAKCFIYRSQTPVCTTSHHKQMGQANALLCLRQDSSCLCHSTTCPSPCGIVPVSLTLEKKRLKSTKVFKWARVSTITSGTKTFFSCFGSVLHNFISGIKHHIFHHIEMTVISIHNLNLKAPWC